MNEYILESYYNHKNQKIIKNIKKEEDLSKVSKRIDEIINDSSFNLTANFIREIHQYLFSNIFNHAGYYRMVNLSKREFILNNDTVFYANYSSIQEYLDYD